MPVTAKLSRKFYETLGDDVANELVEWFNLVDATYRTDLRELNELNFARLDAKLEQRIAELRSEFRQALAGLETKLERRLGEQDAKLDRRITELIRWMFVFWIGTVVPLAGLMVAFSR
jgi:hypothetical protein